MRVIRYINGNKVDDAELPNYVVDHALIAKTIKLVNDRMNTHSAQTSLEKKGN